MLSCRLQCALAALSIVLALGSVTGAPSDPRLRQFLQKSLAAAAGKQVRRLPRRFLSPLQNPYPSLNLALVPLGEFKRCSWRVLVLFWVPQLPKLLGKLSKSRIPLPLLPLSAQSVTGEFFAFKKIPRPGQLSWKVWWHLSLVLTTGGADPGAERVHFWRCYHPKQYPSLMQWTEG